MRKLFTILGALLIALSIFPASATAQMLCGERLKVIAALKEKYQEVPNSVGLSNNGTMIEVFVSDTGSFTIINTRPDGLSCLISAGENWQKAKAQEAGAKI